MIYHIIKLTNPIIWRCDMFKLHAIGLDIRHIGDFIIDRPNGSGDCLLIIFKTNASLTLGGKAQTVSPDTAVIYGRHDKQLYGTVSGNYVNHFLHFDTDSADDFNAVQMNALLSPDNIAEIEGILRMISREQMSESENREKYIDMLIRMVLMKLCEKSYSKPLMLNSIHGSLLTAIRAEMYSNAGQFKSVSELAARANLSSSHFQGIYKKLFGISCYEDLLSAKIKAAQFYLSSTELSVKEIALLCGYDTDTCFMRRFKERMDMTPKEYRELVKKHNFDEKHSF